VYLQKVQITVGYTALEVGNKVVECWSLVTPALFFPCSGYDFGYMVKLLTDSRLPEEEHEFFHILNLFFPSIYDVKYLMKSCKNLKVYIFQY
jgi:hypothetical protein